MSGAVNQRRKRREDQRSFAELLRRPSSVGVWIAAVLWVITGTILQLNRSQGVPIEDTVWDEDGQLFLKDALRDSLEPTLTPAGGYLHVVPRLLGAAAATDLDRAAMILSVGSALLVALLSCYVFFGSRRLLPSSWSRATIAGLIVLLPAASFESLANAANLQYYLVFACFWSLVDRPSGWPRAAAGSAIALATSLSTTLGALLVPISLQSLVRNRGHTQRVASLIFLAGLAVQVITVFRAVILGMDPTLSQYPVRWSESEPLDLPGLYGLRVVVALVVGDRLLDDAWTVLGWGLVVMVVSIVSGALLYGAFRSDARIRTWGLVTLGYSLAFFLLPVAARGTTHLAPLGDMVLFNGNRYVLVPMWFLFTSLLVLLEGAMQRSERSSAVVRVILSLALGLQVVFNYSVDTLRSHGPRWSVRLSHALAQCVSQEGEVRIPITPPLRGPGWRVSAPCDQVTMG
jgi:hypothetical protein